MSLTPSQKTTHWSSFVSLFSMKIVHIEFMLSTTGSKIARAYHTQLNNWAAVSRLFIGCRVQFYEMLWTIDLKCVVPTLGHLRVCRRHSVVACVCVLFFVILIFDACVFIHSIAFNFSNLLLFSWFQNNTIRSHAERLTRYWQVFSGLLWYQIRTFKMTWKLTTNKLEKEQQQQ